MCMELVKNYTGKMVRPKLKFCRYFHKDSSRFEIFTSKTNFQDFSSSSENIKKMLFSNKIQLFSEVNFKVNNFLAFHVRKPLVKWESKRY